MKFKALYLFILLLLMTSCKSNDDNNQIVENTFVVLVNPFPNLSFDKPVDIQNPNDGTDRLFIVEKRGTIKVFENNEFAQSTIFLTIPGNVNNSGEQGLLGLAFHPNYESNGYFYVNYNPNSTLTRISRFKVSNNNPNSADNSSELVLLEFPQDATNHNGGQLTFGPDGYLYISSGDGGPHVNGQDLSTLTGNILRIDVDNPSSGLNYGIPGDNPFISDNSARDEIYAYGLRNPWRMSFDSLTGLLWAGDVGAGKREEIDIIEIGGNYGWNIYEGTECFIGPCDTPDLIPPIFEYDRTGENASITGGYVYRGSLNPELFGKYVYSDFVTGKIWILDLNTITNELIFDTGINVSAFGVDLNNELYFCDYSGGIIYKFVQE